MPSVVPLLHHSISGLFSGIQQERERKKAAMKEPLLQSHRFLHQIHTGFGFVLLQLAVLVLNQRVVLEACKAVGQVTC